MGSIDPKLNNYTFDFAFTCIWAEVSKKWTISILPSLAAQCKAVSKDN